MANESFVHIKEIIHTLDEKGNIITYKTKDCEKCFGYGILLTDEIYDENADQEQCKDCCGIGRVRNGVSSIEDTSNK